MREARSTHDASVSGAPRQGAKKSIVAQLRLAGYDYSVTHFSDGELQSGAACGLLARPHELKRK